MCPKLYHQIFEKNVWLTTSLMALKINISITSAIEVDKNSIYAIYKSIYVYNTDQVRRLGVQVFMMTWYSGWYHAYEL